MGCGCDVVWRWVPGHHWVRLFVAWSAEFEPGHSWLYVGMIRRDAWQLGRLGFGVMRMPRGGNPPVDSADGR